MAMVNSRAAMSPKFALMLSLLLIASMAEGRLFGNDFAKYSSSPSCDSVYGVQSGDTCFAVMQQFKLSAAKFGAINPNLDCNKLFVGQWLCVKDAPLTI